MRKLCILFFISVAIPACSAKTFAPTNEQLAAMQQKMPGVTMENVKAGYILYSQKCAGCHQLYHPDKYTFSQWNNILSKMFPRAKLPGEEQQKLIKEYLHALSK